MKAGVFSIVCIRLGLSVSRISTVAAPAALMSSAVIGVPLPIEGHHHAADPRAQVLERIDAVAAGDQRQDRHQLAGGHDIEAGLARDAVGLRRPGRS